MSTTLPNDHEARLFVTDCLDAIRKAETSEDTETVVEVGAMLWNFIEAMQKNFGMVKEYLRKEALKELNGEPGKAVFNGQNAFTSATVSIPKPTLKLSKNFDADELKAKLGQDFARFFEEKVSYKPVKDTGSKIASLNGDSQQVVAGAIDQVESTPRVSFR
jgi:hypothetical protein